ncbi:MAG: helix-turn-helix transcriptional regulator [Methylococcales bacterium]
MANKQTDLQIIFGETLRFYRNKTGLSQEKLALECSLDRTYISLLERGLRQPSLTTLFDIASSLNIKPSKLIAKVESNLKN